MNVRNDRLGLPGISGDNYAEQSVSRVCRIMWSILFQWLYKPVTIHLLFGNIFFSNFSINFFGSSELNNEDLIENLALTSHFQKVDLKNDYVMLHMFAGIYHLLWNFSNMKTTGSKSAGSDHGSSKLKRLIFNSNWNCCVYVCTYEKLSDSS